MGDQREMPPVGPKETERSRVLAIQRRTGCRAGNRDVVKAQAGQLSLVIGKHQIRIRRSAGRNRHRVAQREVIRSRHGRPPSEHRRGPTGSSCQRRRSGPQTYHRGNEHTRFDHSHTERNEPHRKKFRSTQPPQGVSPMTRAGPGAALME
jgi:hypothetical protein